MSTPTIAQLSPSQLRAGRALIGCSRADLAAQAGTSERVIAAFEAGENVPLFSTMSRMTTALADLGVALIHETADRGAGVFLREPDGSSLRLLRRDPLRRHGAIGFILVIEGERVSGRVEASALVDHGDVDAALPEFDRRRAEILRTALRKLADAAIDDDGHLRVTRADLEADGGRS